MIKAESLLVLCAVVISAAIALIYRMYTRRTMKRIEEMLACAMKGTFEETVYDESRLPSLYKGTHASNHEIFGIFGVILSQRTSSPLPSDAL